MDEPDSAPPWSSNAADAGAGRRRVLVIDDNADAGDTLGCLLDLLGYEAKVARSGSQGLDLLATFQAAAVICDIAMPQMDGYQVAAEIRRRAFAEAPTLIAYTGFGNLVDRAKSTSAGFHFHLTKPVDMDELLTVLRRVPPQ